MEEAPKTYLKPALAFFKDQRILLVKDNKHDKWFMPGGKQEAGETEIEGLKREIKEELDSEIVESSLKFLKEFRDVAYGKANSFLIMRLYLGELKSTPKPSSEILELRYFDSAINPDLLTPISTQIFKWLKTNGYIA